MTHRRIRPGPLASVLMALFSLPLVAQIPPNVPSEVTPTGEDAEDARAAEACEWSHSGGQLAAALCEPGLDQAVWAAAGRAACAGRALCAAWIYDDPAALPDPMPDTFEGLTQQDVTSALAVWVQEDGLLVTIAAAD